MVNLDFLSGTVWNLCFGKNLSLIFYSLLNVGLLVSVTLCPRRHYLHKGVGSVVPSVGRPSGRETVSHSWTCIDRKRGKRIKNEIVRDFTLVCHTRVRGFLIHSQLIDRLKSTYNSRHHLFFLVWNHGGRLMRLEMG